MLAIPSLSVLTLLPLVGALILVLLACLGEETPQRARLAQRVALATSFATFVVSLSVMYAFDFSNTLSDHGFQFVEYHPWLPALGLSYVRGVDGISLAFVMLTTTLMPLCVAVACRITTRVTLLMALLLVLEAMIIGVFSTLDLVLFYVFFEGGLVPMFLIIGLWGGAHKVKAAFKFFLYTFAGSVVMLIAVVVMVYHAGTANMVALAQHRFPEGLALWLCLACIVSFAIKTPMWPVHTWLPWAHVEAPTVGSMILAGILLKMGGYGFIRIGLGIFHDASLTLAPVMMTLSVIAILYGSLVALAQTDMKKLIAYSSVAHMGYATLGIFSGTSDGLHGAMIVMLSHGLVAPALFLGVGQLYERLHTRDSMRYGGVAAIMPRHATLFMIFMLASIALPGLSGFVGEFMVLVGTFKTAPFHAALAAVGVILGAAYMLTLYRRLFFGRPTNGDVEKMPDLVWQEVAVYLPLLAGVFWIGLYPAPLRHMLEPAVKGMVYTVSQKQPVVHANNG